jgi:HTH-type transcriptional regulator, competence development regulator
MGASASLRRNMLHSLAEVYAIPYDLLMEKAGYITASSERKEGAKHGRVATFADENPTSLEEEELLKYLAFLRSRGSRKK